jgi:pimeloyl-ACP methyl ester carboxylesterase
MVDAAPVTSTAERIMFTAGSGGLELTGALFGDPGGGDLIVLTHGSAGRFCDRGYVELGRAFADRGHTVLSGDTRGRDIVALQLVNGEPIAIGGSFERFTESIGDIVAWLRAARRLGPGRLVLAGHSMGCAKAVRALPEADVAGLLLLSPAVVWPPNTDRIRLAAEWTAAGRGEDLLPPVPGYPSWNLVCAATLHERATLIENVFDGPDAPWSSIDVPTLVLYGSDEEDNDDNIARLTAGWGGRRPLVCRVVDGAGHDFRGYGKQVADIVVDWLSGL